MKYFISRDQDTGKWRVVDPFGRFVAGPFPQHAQAKEWIQKVYDSEDE